MRLARCTVGCLSCPWLNPWRRIVLECKWLGCHVETTHTIDAGTEPSWLLLLRWLMLTCWEWHACYTWTTHLHVGIEHRRRNRLCSWCLSGCKRGGRPVYWVTDVGTWWLSVENVVLTFFWKICHTSVSSVRCLFILLLLFLKKPLTFLNHLDVLVGWRVEQVVHCFHQLVLFLPCYEKMKRLTREMLNPCPKWSSTSWKASFLTNRDGLKTLQPLVCPQ